MLTNRLRQIAESLGVSGSVFLSPGVPLEQLLHEEPNGTRWLVKVGSAGVPVITRNPDPNCDPVVSEESIADFLDRDTGSAVRTALIKLIERVLTLHCQAGGEWAGVSISQKAIHR